MPITVLSVDPGVTTGYCLATIDDPKVEISYAQEEFKVSDFYYVLWKYHPDFLVCEDFEYRPGKARPNLVLYSVQLIGICNLWAQINQNKQLFIQKAATGKSFFTDQKIKDLGLYIEGLPHGRDACRHLLHWLTFGYGYQLVAEPEFELSS